MSGSARLPLVDYGSIIPISTGTTEIFKTGRWTLGKPAYKEKISPCREACPAGTDIPAVLALAGKSRLDEALASLLAENPLPGVCGRVCYHPCQDKCNRDELDAPVEIRALERGLADCGSAAPAITAAKSDATVAVVGAGPAGLSAAYFLALLGHRVTLFEERAEPGGVLRYAIPEYRLPKKALKKEIARILTLPIDLRTRARIDQERIKELRRTFDYVFLSTGAWLPLDPGIAGPRPANVVYGLDFLSGKRKRAYGQARSVVVIGGGDVAVDVARTARRLWPTEARVTMVAPEWEGAFPAIAEGLREAAEERVRMIGGYRPVAFEGTDTVEKVRLARTTVERDPETGAYRLLPACGEDLLLDADLVVIAIGQTPDGRALAAAGPDAAHSGLDVDDTGMTLLDGVYAGGDLIRQRRAVVDAIASGKRAAISIDCASRGFDPSSALPAIRLGGGASLSFRAHVRRLSDNGTQAVAAGLPDLRRVVKFGELNTLTYRKAPALAARKLPAGRRERGFREVSLQADAAAVIDEAKRCFNCGRCVACDLCYLLCPDISILKEGDASYGVAEDYCKGCSICATICPRGVIEMEYDR
jgi:NADPH-dependent glutamate synthase beta subunit-like oxidoreductase/Pyruvate/2-oxoacid:ferredoxin oxidoreductase delta subunit